MFGTRFVSFSRRPSTSAPDKLLGFRGWLLLLAVAQCLGTLRTAAGLRQDINAYDELAGILNGGIAATGMALLDIAFVALMVYVTVAMFQRRLTFPALFRCQWYAMIALPVIDLFWTSTILGASVNQLPLGEGLLELAGHVIAGGVWVWYVSVSLRVRNTFTT